MDYSILRKKTAKGVKYSQPLFQVNLLIPEQDFWCSPSSLALPLGQKPQEQNQEQSEELELAQCTVPGDNLTACDRWDYDRSEWPETVVSQFDLVCQR